MRPSQNLPLSPRLYLPFQQLYATLPESTSPSQNLLPPFQQLYATLPESTHPSLNIPPFQQLYATLPESTPPSQNIPPFSKMHMCDPPRIYHSLPDYTLFFNNYMRFDIFVINWIITTSLPTVSRFNSFKYFFISDLTIQGSYKIVNYFIMYFFCVVIQYVRFVC